MYVSLCNMSWTKLIHIKDHIEPGTEQTTFHGGKDSPSTSPRQVIEKILQDCCKTGNMAHFSQMLAVTSLSHLLHHCVWFQWKSQEPVCPIIYTAPQPDQVQALFGASYTCKCISILLSQTNSGTPRLAMTMNVMVTMLPTYLGGISRANILLDSIFL